MPAESLKLLSPTLRAELDVSQRSPHLASHPLFMMLQRGQPHIFRDLCGAFVTRMYEPDEQVTPVHPQPTTSVGWKQITI